MSCFILKGIESFLCNISHRLRLSFCFILKGIESILTHSPILYRPFCFILKGIESICAHIWVSISHALWFHPQRNWKVNVAPKYHARSASRFILKGIESISLFPFFPSPLPFVSSSKELKGRCWCGDTVLYLKFHPQRNWKLVDGMTIPPLRCSCFILKGIESLTAEGLSIKYSSFILKGIESLQESYSRMLDQVNRFHPQRNWK